MTSLILFVVLVSVVSIECRFECSPPVDIRYVDSLHKSLCITCPYSTHVYWRFSSAMSESYTDIVHDDKFTKWALDTSNYEFDRYSYTLIIRNVSENDIGWYQCASSVDYDNPLTTRVLLHTFTVLSSRPSSLSCIPTESHARGASVWYVSSQDYRTVNVVVYADGSINKDYVNVISATNGSGRIYINSSYNRPAVLTCSVYIGFKLYEQHSYSITGYKTKCELEPSYCMYRGVCKSTNTTTATCTCSIMYGGLQCQSLGVFGITVVTVSVMIFLLLVIAVCLLCCFINNMLPKYV